MKIYKLLLIVALPFFQNCASLQHGAVMSTGGSSQDDDWYTIIYYNVLLKGDDYPLYGALLSESIDSLSNPNKFSKIDDLLCRWHQAEGYLLDGSSVTVPLIPDSVRMKGIIGPANANLMKLYNNLATKDYSFTEGILSCKVGIVRGAFFDVSTTSSLVESSDAFYETNADCLVEYRFITDLAEVLKKKEVQLRLDRGLFSH